MQNEFELDVENGRGWGKSRIILILSSFLYSFRKTEAKSTAIYCENSTLLLSMSLNLILLTWRIW